MPNDFVISITARLSDLPLPWAVPLLVMIAWVVWLNWPAPRRSVAPRHSLSTPVILPPAALPRVPRRRAATSQLSTRNS